MRKGQSRRQNRNLGRKRLSQILFEGLEGRQLYSTATLVQQGPALQSPAASDGAAFGSVVATQGNLALVAGLDGSVTLFDTTTNAATVYTDPSPGDGFGMAVAFYGSDGSFAIGAPFDGDGKVYLYHGGSQTGVLTPGNYDRWLAFTTGDQSSRPAMGFGAALAGNGNLLLIDTNADPAAGYQGSVMEVNPADGGAAVGNAITNPTGSSGGADQFGLYMAASGNRIVLYGMDATHPGQGAVYLYDASAFLTGQGPTLTFADPTGDANLMFGTSLALSGDTLVVGAPGSDVSVDDATGTMAMFGGSVYQYNVAGGGEAPVHVYAQPDTVVPFVMEGFVNSYSRWGWGLAISGNQLLIGAPSASNGAADPESYNSQGQVYAYDLGTYEELGHAATEEQGSEFGMAIAALGDGRFLVADPYSSLGGAAYGGQVYVYAVNAQTVPPTAVVSGDLTGLVNQSVSLSGTGSTPGTGSSISSYEWDFNYDGTAADFVAAVKQDAAHPDVSHVFDTAGTYTVALRVTDASGRTSIDTMQVTVGLPAAPTADAGADRAALAGSVVALHGTGGAGTVSYAWDFDYDGSHFTADEAGAYTVNGVDGSVVYTVTGAHTVALQVTDAYGQSTIATMVVTVSALPPSADAGSNQSAVAGNAVTLHGVAGAGLGSAVTAVEWDFDYDGVTFHPMESGTDPSYVYTSAGAHNVAFRVTDGDGQSAIGTAVVTVTAAAPSADAGADQSAVAGNAVAFHGTAVAGIGATVSGVAWDFNYDGVTFHPMASGTDASYVYLTAGSHTVAFRVTDSDGQTAVDTMVVGVTAGAPTANAGANQSGTQGQAVSFHGVATAGTGATVASVAWDFKYDGVTFHAMAAGADASYVYTSAGTYTAAFRVTDSDGQTAIGTAVVTVAAPAPPVVVVGGQVQVTGTASNDTITVDPDKNGNVVITLNGVTYGPFAKGSTVVIYGGAGDDVITGGRKVNANLVIFGGAGNDTITGGGGADILVGGDGNDVIVAGADTDLLIGGAGADNLSGKAGQDIVVAGWTSYDNNLTALNAILAEWMSSRTLNKRVANLLNGSGSSDRLNGSYFLSPGSTVFDDAIVDTLSGGGGKDWLIFNATGSGVLDVLSGGAGADVITDL